ncbi:MAG TPA: PspC domain-containing protein [Allosphingosinicella sp.]|nr:PspC domain-containing protein [Allosphingosinicella sp.]
MPATAAQPPANVFMREDTFFGVCQALGEDFGFNPLWLRLAFALSLYWNPTGILATYAALGVIVLISRLVVRNPRPAVARASAGEPAAAAAPPAADNEVEAEPLAVAA